MNDPAAQHANSEPGYRRIFGLAWPIILANIAQPLLGLVDTAILGNLGTVESLGAIALGALIFSFVYWSFGFLRMGTTGFVAQAQGQGDAAEVRAATARGLIIAAALGTALWLLRGPIAAMAFQLFEASPIVEARAAHYLTIRFWGAPAALGMFVLTGVLIGTGHTRLLLLIQVVLNGLNIVLDVWFAGVLGWGAAGVALGTAVSEWSALLLGLWLVIRTLRAARRDTEPFWPIERLRDAAALRATLSANTNIMIRTLFLLAAFAWFTNQGAQFGDAVLAGNHILLQFITFSAYFLDGYAQAAESVVGNAFGTRRQRLFDATVWRSTVWAVLTAVALAAVIGAGGGLMIDGLTSIDSVRAVAKTYLPWCALYVALSCAAFQLDGVFIGAGGTRAMRNASIVSSLGFVALAVWLAPRYGNHGLWAAFVSYVVFRAAALAVAYPRLRARLAGPG